MIGSTSCKISLPNGNETWVELFSNKGMSKDIVVPEETERDVWVWLRLAFARSTPVSSAKSTPEFPHVLASPAAAEEASENRVNCANHSQNFLNFIGGASPPLCTSNVFVPRTSDRDHATGSALCPHVASQWNGVWLHHRYRCWHS